MDWLTLLTKLVDNLPQILLGLAAVSWGVARVVEARAKGNPAQTWEDDWAPWLQTVAAILAKGIDMLATWQASKGNTKLQTGEKKLEAMKLKVAELEALWKSGRKRDAITELFAWYVDLQGKVERLTPPTSVPPAGSQVR